MPEAGGLPHCHGAAPGIARSGHLATPHLHSSRQDIDGRPDMAAKKTDRLHGDRRSSGGEMLTLIELLAYVGYPVSVSTL
jgi:hypothetical protein